jgi:hypothetical protein
LLNELTNIDHGLAQNLHGPNGEFTYDSPKFVEATIRIARGLSPHLAWDPVLRFDADVSPNPTGIQLLLDSYVQINDLNPYYFFSGGYGNHSGLPDWINDYAVRTHWLAQPGSRDGTTLKIDESERIRMFLADLNELGATQLDGSPKFYSSALKLLLGGTRHPSMPERKSPQVISGAGLVMAPRAICALPPFMNVSNATIWVDDHLKRRVHEAVEHIRHDHPERIRGALFEQSRHGSQGITDIEIRWAIDQYFDRLLRGCLLRRLVNELDGSATSYSLLLKEIVKSVVVSGLTRRIDKRKSDWFTALTERYEEVLTCWAGVEYHGTVLQTWIKKRHPKLHRDVACRGVLDDAIRYLHLTNAWPIFVRSIEELSATQNQWLFVKA